MLFKVLSDSPSAIFKKIYRAKLVLVSGFTLLVLTNILEILEKIYLENP